MSEEEIIKEVKGFLDFEEGISMKTIQGLLDLYNNEKDKINSKIEEYEEILDSPIIKEDYKREVEHIIRVLKELGGKNE